MSRLLRFTALCCALAVCFAAGFGAAAAAGEAESAYTAYTTGTRPMSIAHMGDWRRAPENSTGAIAACTSMGIDIISTYVRFTEDKACVLLRDETIDRMLANEAGNPVSGSVSEYTLEQLRRMVLRQGRGGEEATATGYPIATLEEALTLTKNKALLLLYFDWAQREDVYEAIKELDAFADIIFYSPVSTKEFDAWATAKTQPLLWMGSYAGNVIFSLLPKAGKLAKAGAQAITLSSGNENGILFSSWVLGKVTGKGLRACVSTTDPARSGKRDDNAAGWDALLSRGYSMIETNDPTHLAAYLEENVQLAKELEDICEQAKALDVSVYSNATKNAFLTAQQAAEELLQKGCFSNEQAIQARYDLQTAMDTLERAALGETVKGEWQFSFGKLAAAVGCTLALAGLGLFFWKKTEKAN